MLGPKLQIVVLDASDVEASTRFYRDAMGIPLDVVGHVIDGGVRFVIQAAAGEPTRRALVGFAVPNLERAHARAAKMGAKVVHEPRTEPWGRTARYEDPDGNVVSLTQPRRSSTMPPP